MTDETREDNTQTSSATACLAGVSVGLSIPIPHPGARLILGIAGCGTGILANAMRNLQKDSDFDIDLEQLDSIILDREAPADITAPDTPSNTLPERDTVSRA